MILEQYVIFQELYTTCVLMGARGSKGLTAADSLPSRASGSSAQSGFPRAVTNICFQSLTPVKSCGRKKGKKSSVAKEQKKSAGQSGLKKNRRVEISMSASFSGSFLRINNSDTRRRHKRTN